MTEVELVAAQDRVPSESPTYADADWMSPGLVTAARLVVRGSEDHAGADRAAGIRLIRLAAKVQECLGDEHRSRVEVLGGGLVAGVVAHLLGDRAAAGGAHPSAVVDTTGDPAEIRAALGRLDDLGTLILAGEVGGRALELDLYPDVHVRGLRIVGVGLTPADIADPPAVPADALDLLDRWPPAALAPADSSTPARWYRLS